ncbi:DinB family protein [Chloroflexota bacterium]
MNKLTTRESIREELEETREAFHVLLNQMSAKDWERKSGNQSWTKGELMMHIVTYLSVIPNRVERVRKGTPEPTPPAFIVNIINIPLTKLLGRRESLDTAGIKYDEAHAKTITSLEMIEDDEWGKIGKFYGNMQDTVESLFRFHNQHYKEHEAQIRQSLGNDKRNNRITP